jgi:lipid-A-disaccharide synthase
MAKWARTQGYKVFYYISPQLWAWHTSRVKIIQEAVTKMYVILPFEKEFYARYHVDVLYIGHPLAFEIGSANKEYKPQAKKIALLPGSRRHEIMKILPEMKQLAVMMPDHQFTVIAVSHLPLSLYKSIIGDLSNVSLSVGHMQETLLTSEAAIVTSGTATLETALIGVPQIVVYKGNAISFWLAKRLVNVKYISLVNLIPDQKVVPELIQEECNAQKMHESLEQILQTETSNRMRTMYDQLRALLMSGGGPAEAADDIYHHIKKQ